VCGRFTLRADPKAVAEHFGLDAPPAASARYNIAPGQAILTVRAVGDGRVGEARVWGLVPAWAKSAAIGSRMINARAETLADKPAFRAAFRQRRCLIPADGFYEWQKGAGPAQPVHIAPAAGGLFGFAGLFEEWSAEGQPALATCTIVTTAADARLSAIHHRMPVILPPESYAPWLDPAAGDTVALRQLLDRGDPMELAVASVGTRVNDVRNDDAGCLAPAPPQPRQGTLL
jgi:putative SOS response-associated peptidase YedK